MMAVLIASFLSLMKRDFALPFASMPAFMSSIMSSVRSVRLLSDVTMILSASLWATCAISGRLVLSLSPPHPKRHISSLSGAMSRSVVSTFSRASGVWA